MSRRRKGKADRSGGIMDECSLSSYINPVVKKIPESGHF